MRKGRNHTIMSLLLAIAIMISGICLDRIPANSFFSCKETSVISVAGRPLKSVSAYKTETLDQREVLSSINQSPQNVDRNSVRTRWSEEVLFLSTDNLTQDFRLYISAKENRLYYETLCSITILNYIHEQDGEKVLHHFKCKI